MKLMKFKGVARTFNGKPVVPALPFSGEFNAYTEFDEVERANDTLNNEEQVKARNAQRKAKASAAAKAKVLKDAGYEVPTIQNDLYTRIKTVYSGIYAGNNDHEQAKSLTIVALSLTEGQWPEDLNGEDEGDE